MDAGRRRSKKCNRQRRGPLGAEGSEGLKPKKALDSFIRAGSSTSLTPLLFCTPQKVPPKWQIFPGANLGVECRGCAPPPSSVVTCGFLMQMVFAKTDRWILVGLDSNHHALLDEDRDQTKCSLLQAFR